MITIIDELQLRLGINSRPFVTFAVRPTTPNWIHLNNNLY